MEMNKAETLVQQAAEWVANYRKAHEWLVNAARMQREHNMHISVREPEQPEDLSEPLRSKVLALLNKLPSAPPGQHQSPHKDSEKNTYFQNKNSLFFRPESTLTQDQRDANIAARLEKNETMINNRKFTINHKFIGHGELCISVPDITGLRWGKYAHSDDIDIVKYMIFITSKSYGQMVIEWQADRADEIESSNYKQVTFWINKYARSSILKLFYAKVEEQDFVNIGHLKCTREGVNLTAKGLLKGKTSVCPWSRLQTNVERGAIVVFDWSNPSFKASINLIEVDNAFMLHNLDLSRPF